MTTTNKPIGLLIITTIVIVGLLTGCASVFQDFDDKMSRKRFKKDFEALDAALDAYDQGNFNKALGLYKKIRAASTNATIRRRAWLGEICCSLLLADTASEFTAAVGMWHDFQESTKDEDAIWDQALLDPLIVRQTPRPAPTIIEVPAPAVPPAISVPEKKTVQKQAVAPQEKQAPSEAELEALVKKANRADKLQLQIAKILAENRSLKEKIKALEAIDQNIQKKKTEISTSGE